ncbi:MAG: hypothetical protein RJA70_3709 [Pseudomonadota bacterium]
MTRFRPCIDLHQGLVKQIVGGSLQDDQEPQTNFTSTENAAHYSALYRADGLTGGHVIALGPGNEQAASSALAAWPKGLQFGGGVTADNAQAWLDRGASHVIVTSFLFELGELSERRLRQLAERVPAEQVVIDLSCRRGAEGWHVATNRWQTVTSTPINAATLEKLSPYCAEFLVHAADVEGLCQGIDEELVTLLGQLTQRPCTYAGGAKDIADLERVQQLSGGRIDLTFGSALDLFGGRGVRYADCVAFNRAQTRR